MPNGQKEIKLGSAAGKIEGFYFGDLIFGIDLSFELCHLTLTGNFFLRQETNAWQTGSDVEVRGVTDSRENKKLIKCESYAFQMSPPIIFPYGTLIAITGDSDKGFQKFDGSRI